jgi:hypothetical protein
MTYLHRIQCIQSIDIIYYYYIMSMIQSYSYVMRLKFSGQNLVPGSYQYQHDDNIINEQMRSFDYL